MISLNAVVSKDMELDLKGAAEQLAEALRLQDCRIVFAESCTAGLVSATLARVPGVSKWHCGSAVVYRETTKTAWLAIPPEMIAKHGAVSAEVAQLMAAGVLQFTPEADISAAITGHLGPDAPAELDGVAFIALARREESSVVFSAVERVKLNSSDRMDRQHEAALAVLENSIKSIS